MYPFEHINFFYVISQHSLYLAIISHYFFCPHPSFSIVFQSFPMNIHHSLVVSTPLKNMKINFDDDIPNCFWENIKFIFQSPPTRSNIRPIPGHILQKHKHGSQLIGFRVQKLQENPMIFMGKSGWFPVFRFSLQLIQKHGNTPFTFPRCIS